MFKSFFNKVFPKKSDRITVSIAPADNSLIVRLCVNNIQKAKMQCIIQSAQKIMIGDIIHENAAYDRGYGSMMVEELIEYTRKNHYVSIYGNLSVVDLDHKDRLHHFYQKFGFIITEYPCVQDNFYGKIELTL